MHVTRPIFEMLTFCGDVNPTIPHLEEKLNSTHKKQLGAEIFFKFLSEFATKKWPKSFKTKFLNFYCFLHGRWTPTRKNTFNICLRHIGKLESTVLISVENRDRIRPIGVVSKNSCGAAIMQANISRCSIDDAFNVPLASNTTALAYAITA